MSIFLPEGGDNSQGISNCGGKDLLQISDIAFRLTNIDESLMHLKEAILQEDSVGIFKRSEEYLVGNAPDYVGAIDAERRYVKHKTQIFSDLNFENPNWNILLELFEAQINGKSLTVKSACYSSKIPMTTALRYIELLVATGYVEKSNDPSDGRRTLLSLTAAGRTKMAKALGVTPRSRVG